MTASEQAKHYNPIGVIYEVEFLDARGYTWDHRVVVPYDEDVAAVLAILERAYPGNRIRSLKDAGYVHHGSVGVQDYRKAKE